MGVEKYIAAASLGLFIMFVGEIITIYDFMIDPMADIEPAPKILQFISIGIAPAVIMCGVSFIMAKRYGSKPIGSMLLAGGVILLVGMLYANTLVEDIDPIHQIFAVKIVPPLFMAVSIPVIIVGALLFRIKKKRPKKEYL